MIERMMRLMVKETAMECFRVNEMARGKSLDIIA